MVHFAFECYGFETYNALVNPNNPLARAVLTAMVESGDYFFFALDSNESATAFRSEIGQGSLLMFKNNLATHPRLDYNGGAVQQSGSVFHKESQTARPAAALGVPGGRISESRRRSPGIVSGKNLSSSSLRQGFTLRVIR